MKTIVIFGASGNLGQYFIKYFLDNTKDIKEYDLVACGTRDDFSINSPYVKYCKVDITQMESFSILPQAVDYVVDFAGIMPARMEGYNPYKYIDVNITGTLNILEYCRIAKADRILFTQSFGDIKDYGNECTYLTPDMPRKIDFGTDHTVYVLSKNFAVDLIRNYYEMYGVKGFIFRLPTIHSYSKIDHFFVDGVRREIGYKKLINQAIQGETIEIWGDPFRVKDMVYVKDFCQMVYKALYVNRSYGYYNVGTGIGTTLEDQVKGMVEVFGSDNHKSHIIYAPEKPNAPQYIMDITSARNELGYEPQYNYIDMLKDYKREMLRDIG